MLKFHQFYSPKKYPKVSKTHSCPTGNGKKPIFLNGKPLKNQKIEGKNRNFPENFFHYSAKSGYFEFLQRISLDGSFGKRAA